MKKVISPLFFLFILSAGAQNVGIGTTTPTDKLHVIGNIRADTVKPNVIRYTPNAGPGKVMTSDAIGNASWQEVVATGGAGSTGVGYGSWGDCSMNGVSEYNPVADTTAQEDDYFGSSVSISGNYAFIGANFDDVGANQNQGSASIYQFNGSNWVVMEKITEAGGSAEDNFGSSVSVSGNFAAVSVPGDDEGGSNRGSVMMYHFNGSAWVFTQKLTDATGASGDNFGLSVSVSGNYLIVGAPDDDNAAVLDQGSISIFQYNGSSWVFMQKIFDATGTADDRFGFAVSISGSYCIAGAPEEANLTGSASIYQYNGSSWVLMQKLTDPAGQGFDNFGCSVSISGNFAVVGAFGDDNNRGSAVVFRLTGSSWPFMQKITEPTGSQNDLFGISVCLSGNYVIVGAAADNINLSIGQGSATIFTKIGAGWQKLQFISDPGGKQFDSFGISTSFDATTKRFLVGANGYADFSGKAVFGKLN